MDIFASDLDNTLIYSYKRDIGDNNTLVERYEGREVSYMTACKRMHCWTSSVRSCCLFPLPPAQSNSIKESIFQSSLKLR